jgi:DNA-binding GntR family transcriptional regulator
MTLTSGLRRPETLTDAVARHISEAIVRGEFPPGSNLPEVGLSRRLETSRGTVREALRALATGGLVEIVPHRGVFVSRLSTQGTWEITSLRAILEPYAARLAVERVDERPDMVAGVDEAFERLAASAETHDPLAIVEADIAFHQAVVARCGHQMLLDQLQNLQVLSRRLMILGEPLVILGGPSAATRMPVVRQHAPIVEAVRRGDPAAVEDAVRTHVVQAGERFMAEMSARPAGDPGAAVVGAARGWPAIRTPGMPAPLTIAD